MKDRRNSVGMLLLFLLALLLILQGFLWSMRTFSHFEQLALGHQNHDQLLQALETTALYWVACCIMVAAGALILVLQLLHIGRRAVRIQREADLLRKKNEAAQALVEKNQQLAHHQRLQTIGTLTSSIAHEFNNLLTPIMGYSMMVLEQLPMEQEELYDQVLEIYNASRKAKTIISRLSDLSRKNSDLTFRQVNVDVTVRKTLEVAAPAKPPRVEVKLDLNCWDQRLRANEIQLSQLMLNLVLNGFHAMEEKGGALTVSTSFDEDFIHIRVEDEGCGMPEEVKERIFEPFFTTKEPGKGTGLGLAIAAQVAEDHGGSIGVESKEGAGTVFAVRLSRNGKFPQP